ncbi:MAG TPA: helix-turn-helix domain-containing protein [Actinoplanes sp.]|nr:helix-turn-helix domain-containing protein [Actinoplanes sp.]
MLHQLRLIDSGALRLTTVGCPGGTPWSAEEPVTTAAVVLVRRGVFRRRVNGAESLADTTTGYVQRPGECQQVGHPAGGDVCTTIGVPPELADRLARTGPLIVPAAADLAHRRVLAATRHPRPAQPDPARPDPAQPDPAQPDPARPNRTRFHPAQRHPAPAASDLVLSDLATDVLAALLPATAPPRSSARIDDVRAALHADPGRTLADLATVAGWSPWHLSRAFHQVTGVTIGTYRRRLRTRAALDALADGDTPAAVAARTGFADQAHLTRALRREVALSPAVARRLFAG